MKLVNNHLSYYLSKKENWHIIEFLLDVYNLFKNNPQIMEEFKKSIYKPKSKCNERDWQIWISFMGLNLENKNVKQLAQEFNMSGARVRIIFHRTVYSVRKFLFSLASEN